MITRPRMLERIKEHEGLRLKPYECPTGFLSIGYGRNLESVGISTDEAEMLLRNDLWGAERQAERFPWFEALNGPRQEVIIEMIFQLGFDGVRQFRRMIAAIEREDWPEAAAQMKDSRWHEQTPGRCEELAGIMERGE